MTLKRSHHGRAFTMVEVLIATALSAVIGVAVSMMLTGIASETLVHDDLRRQTMTREVVIARLGSLLRPGAMVLDLADDRVVVWRGDFNRNGAPDLSELLVLSHDDDSRTLTAFAAPDGQEPEAGPTYTLLDDFGAIASAHAGTALLPGTPLIKNLESLEFRPDRADIGAARRVCIDAVYHEGSDAHSITTISSLRASPDIPCSVCPPEED